MSPCLTTVVSYNWIHFLTNPITINNHNCPLSLPFSFTFYIFQSFVSNAGPYASVKVTVINWSVTYFWKQVRDNPVKEFEIILEKLGHVYISYSSEDNEFLQMKRKDMRFNY